ncbi:MAG: twin-arginine translocation signal domain-containing protein [Candidatus Hydrogenedens sp.]|nr:twin-arginine translocation signal domain-containing protein [Candidatus Hydrogenedens sp.]
MAITRRKFLGATAAAVVVAGTKASGKVWGANERIGVCTIGFNGQGKTHIGDILERADQYNVQYTALCDADDRVLKSGARLLEKKYGAAPKTYNDMREVMEDKDVDAITIATPNHWHSLAAVWGCQAGKDVYVEKPISHNIWEGRQVAAAAKKYDRIVQHGTQSRSNSTLLRDIKLIHDGFIGPISHSRGYVYKNGNRMAIGKGMPAAPPDDLHYDLWQGPAQETPYQVVVDNPKRGLWVHYNWHWFWEFGNGEIGNQGVHEMDIACWMHNRGMPTKIMSQGGRYAWDDDGQTPNTQATSFTYPDGSMMTFEVRNLGSFEEADGDDCGNSCFGTEGYYVRNRGFFDYKNQPIEVSETKPDSPSKFDRFFMAIRSRDASINPCDADVAHVSAVHCHLGNIAYRLGRSLEFDPAVEQFVGDDEANTHVKRDYRQPFEVPQLA